MPLEVKALSISNSDMKQFIIKIFFFALLVAVVFGGWSAALLVAEYKNYQKEIIMPKDTSILVCGDSHTEAALDPAYFLGLYNFSQSACVLDQSLLKLKDFFKRNPGRIKTVLVDVSPLQLYCNDVTMPLAKAGPPANLFLLHCYHRGDTRRSLDGIVGIFRDTILAKRTRALWKSVRKKRPYKSSLKGGYIPSDKRGFVSVRDKVYAEMHDRAKQINKSWQLTEDVPIVQDVLATIRFAKDNGARVVLMTTPFHRELTKLIEPKRLNDFFSLVNEIAKREKLQYVNCFYWDFPDDQWRDANHLNQYASKAFTERLKKEIK